VEQGCDRLDKALYYTLQLHGTAHVDGDIANRERASKDLTGNATGQGQEQKPADDQWFDPK